MGVIFLHICRLHSRYLSTYSSSSSIGCALSAPDGSSPRGYVWILVVKHRLEVHVFFLLLFVYYLQAPESKSRFFIPCDHNLLFLVL
jgi:hypothetical protein